MIIPAERERAVEERSVEEVLQNRRRGGISQDMARWQHAPLFRGWRFADDFIILAVRWYFRRQQWFFAKAVNSGNAGTETRCAMAVASF